MNIFIDLPFEFLRKIVLFSFWYDKIYIYDCFYITFMVVLRAPIVDVANAKYLALLPHQTQKIPPIRCCICAKIIPFLSVPLQICNGTDRNGKLKYYF